MYRVGTRAWTHRLPVAHCCSQALGWETSAALARLVSLSRLLGGDDAKTALLRSPAHVLLSLSKEQETVLVQRLVRLRDALPAAVDAGAFAARAPQLLLCDDAMNDMHENWTRLVTLFSVSGEDELAALCIQRPDVLLHIDETEAALSRLSHLLGPISVVDAVMNDPSLLDESTPPDHSAHDPIADEYYL